MFKKFLLLIFVFSLLIFTSGCWSYTGLNDLSIVTGFAVDKDETNYGYNLTFEVIDLTGDIKSGIKTQLVESNGKTIHDAIRNAGRKIHSRLYFGNNAALVIGNKVVSEESIASIVDLLLRDLEPRETMEIVVSSEKTARELLKVKTVEDAIDSYNIRKMIENDDRITASTKHTELYQVKETLNTEGKSLALPTAQKVINDGEEVAEIGGIAAFKDGMVVGYLTPEESKYFLVVTNEIKSGTLTFKNTPYNDLDRVGLEITGNKTKIKHSFKDNKIKIIIETETDANIGELKMDIDVMDEKELKKVEEQAGEELKQRMENVIYKVQNELKTDIFGFGNTIYKYDNKLWKQIGTDWDKYFEEMEFEVITKVKIQGTSTVKRY